MSLDYSQVRAREAGHRLYAVNERMNPNVFWDESSWVPVGYAWSRTPRGLDVVWEH